MEIKELREVGQRCRPDGDAYDVFSSLVGPNAWQDGAWCGNQMSSARVRVEEGGHVIEGCLMIIQTSEAVSKGKKLNVGVLSSFSYIEVLAAGEHSVRICDGETGESTELHTGKQFGLGCGTVEVRGFAALLLLGTSRRNASIQIAN